MSRLVEISFFSSDQYCVTVDLDEVTPGVDISDPEAVLRDYDDNERGPMFDKPVGIAEYCDHVTFLQEGT